MTCEYCNEAITDTRYTYKYFGLERKMQPVHSHHLVVNRSRTFKVHDPFKGKGDSNAEAKIEPDDQTKT